MANSNGGCGAWLEMSQKNKPQSNTLAAGVITMVTSGMYVGSTIFNKELTFQPWTFDHDLATVRGVTFLFYLAAIIGSMLGYFLVERYEKKQINNVFLALAAVASVLLIAVPDHIASVAFARILMGLAHGMAYLVVLIHGGEVCIKQIRGMNMISVGFCIMIGVVTYGALAPTYAHDIGVNRIVGILGLVYVLTGGLIGIFLTYESPVYLIQRGRDGEAIQAMMKLRNESIETWDIRNDYTEFKTMLQEDEESSPSIFTDGNVRPLVLMILCRIASVLSFNYAINMVRLYALDRLIVDDDEGLYSLSAVLILCVRMIVGTFFLFVIDKFGRKTPMTLSSLASGVVLVIMGIIYLISDSVTRDVQIGLVLTYEVVASAGVTLVPDVYCSEAFATKKKAFSIAAVHTIEYVLQIVIMALTFWINASFGVIMLASGVPLVLLGAIFFTYLPETTKMSIRQSRTEFSKRGEIVFGGTKKPQTYLND